MLAGFIRSPAVVELFLLLMLLAWLTVSAVMTLRAGRYAGQRDTAPMERRQPGRATPTMPPAARAITGAPRS